MDYLVCVFYPLLAFLLLWKSKFFKKGSFNDDVLSISQTKALQGFTAVLIMFHHMSQQTCAYWLKPEYIHHGLEPFVSIGYLFVAIFFFYSGYGLLKSFKNKENYLKGFLPKRISPIFVATVLIGLVFMLARNWMRDRYSIFNISIGEPATINPNGWFPYTICIFYIGFYLAYRFCKNQKTALFVTCAVVVLYMLFCDFNIYGTWWYNSAPAFAAGLVLAEYEDRIISSFKKHYVLNFIIFGLLSAVSIFFAVQHPENWDRLVILFAQIISSVVFVFFLLLVGLKVKIGNKILAWLGTMTLELYLIHGLFVYLFGFCFISERVESLYYISNPALYVIVVIVLSIPSAMLFKLIDSKIVKFFQKRQKLARNLNKDVLRFVGVVLVFFGLLIALASYRSHKDTRLNVPAKVDPYIEQNITFVEVDGRKMAVDVHGEGEHTIVFLSPTGPTLTLKELASFFTDDFRVVLIDKFGTGFSDITDRPRTTENIVDEYHECLQKLGINKYILIGHMQAGLQTMLYANKYADEIEQIMEIDCTCFEEFKEEMRAFNINRKNFNRMIKRASQVQYNQARLLNSTGIIRWVWATYEIIFRRDHNEDFMLVMEEMFKKSYYNKNSYDEDVYTYDNNFAVENMKYPAAIPTEIMIGYYTWKEHYYYGDWYYYHEHLLSENPLSELHVIEGDGYTAYWNTRALSKIIRTAIKKLD